MVKNANTNVKGTSPKVFNRKILTSDSKTTVVNEEVKEFPNRETDQIAINLNAKIERNAPKANQISKKGQKNVDSLIKTQKRSPRKINRTRESAVYAYYNSAYSIRFNNARKELDKQDVIVSASTKQENEGSFKNFLASMNFPKTIEEINEEMFVVGCVKTASDIAQQKYNIVLDAETQERIVDDILTNTIVEKDQVKEEVFADVAIDAVIDEVYSIIEEENNQQ